MFLFFVSISLFINFLDDLDKLLFIKTTIHLFLIDDLAINFNNQISGLPWTVIIDFSLWEYMSDYFFSILRFSQTSSCLAVLDINFWSFCAWRHCLHSRWNFRVVRTHFTNIKNIKTVKINFFKVLNKYAFTYLFVPVL